MSSHTSSVFKRKLDSLRQDRGGLAAAEGEGGNGGRSGGKQQRSRDGDDTTTSNSDSVISDCCGDVDVADKVAEKSPCQLYVSVLLRGDIKQVLQLSQRVYYYLQH